MVSKARLRTDEMFPSFFTVTVSFIDSIRCKQMPGSDQITGLPSQAQLAAFLRCANEKNNLI